MSRPRIDTQELLAALREGSTKRGRPITAVELAHAYYERTGVKFNSDSLTRRLDPHLRKKTVTRNKGRHGQYQYAPTGQPT